MFNKETTNLTEGKYKVEVQVIIGQMDANGNVYYGGFNEGRLQVHFNKAVSCTNLKEAFELVDKYNKLTEGLE